MTFDDRIERYEARKSKLSEEEVWQRMQDMQQLQAISVFEGLTATPAEQKLYKLFAEGKITKQEYYQLCLHQIGQDNK